MKVAGELVVEDAGADLQQEVGTTRCRTTAELPPSVTSACLAIANAQNRYDDAIGDFPV